MNEFFTKYPGLAQLLTFFAGLAIGFLIGGAVQSHA
jgi:hypothetical protein